MAMASRPGSAGKIEIEAADDFLLSSETLIQGGTFTGLIPVNDTVQDIQQVVLEIYRVFPADSDVSRTSGPPTFSTAQVPTRVNSPADVEFEGADFNSGGVSYSTSILTTSFTALNSVLNGIHPKPDQATLGEGQVTGQEVEFTFSLTTPFDLPADHYFFVPQVELSNGNFFWLSGTRPIVPPGTPFMPDLQAWIRNADLDPDWLRVGTDIVDGTTPPTFNGAFTLTGQTVPEPSTVCLTLLGLGGIALFRKFRRAQL